MRRWVIQNKGLLYALFFGGLGAWVAPLIGIPGGSFTGAMLVTGAANLILGNLKDAPGWMQMLAKVLLGLSIGVSVTDETLHAIAHAFTPVTLMIVAVTALGLVAALAIVRFTGMRLPTALCGAAPGALPAMVSLSEELGGEPPVVATMHLIRLVSILLIIPSLAAAAFPTGAHPVAAVTATETGPFPTVISLAILVTLGLASVWLGKKIKMPAADLLTPMIVAAVVNPAWLHISAYPTELRLYSNWVIGLGVGASIDLVTLRRFRPFAVAGALMTAFLITSGLALGWLLSSITDIDLLTALLGCAPGGATALIVLSGELGADPQLVAAMHVTRMVILMALLPLLIRSAARRGATKQPVEPA